MCYTKRVLSVKVSKDNLLRLKEDFKDYIIEENVGYILFVAKKDGYMITAYDNKNKNYNKVTFQGPDPLKIASIYSDDVNSIPKKKKISKESPIYIDVDFQIGSDEVGTGDFLGPIVVCAAYVDEETMKIIEEYHISDSKKLSDKQILNFVPLILKKVYYEAKVLTNEKFNNATSKGFNLNKVKAILHNYCLLKLHARFPYVHNVYVDQFCTGDKYYSYLEGMSKVQRNIVFREKGETYFPSVALASCIARYLFLREIDALNHKYNVNIPLGASGKVNIFSRAFIHKFGIEEFNKIAKKSFANYDDVLDMLNPSLV